MASICFATIILMVQIDIVQNVKMMVELCRSGVDKVMVYEEGWHDYEKSWVKFKVPEDCENVQFSAQEKEGSAEKVEKDNAEIQDVQVCLKLAIRFPDYELKINTGKKSPKMYDCEEFKKFVTEFIDESSELSDKVQNNKVKLNGVTPTDKDVLKAALSKIFCNCNKGKPKEKTNWALIAGSTVGGLVLVLVVVVVLVVCWLKRSRRRRAERTMRSQSQKTSKTNRGASKKEPKTMIASAMDDRSMVTAKDKNKTAKTNKTNKDKTAKAEQSKKSQKSVKTSKAGGSKKKGSTSADTKYDEEVMLVKDYTSAYKTSKTKK